MSHRTKLDPERLRRRRIAAGLSQTALAEKAGVNNSHISQVEHGRKGFSPASLGRLATALGCEITDFMPTESEPESQPEADAAPEAGAA